MATINIYGAGGHAKVIKDIIEAQGDRVEVFFDDHPKTDSLHGIEVRKSTVLDNFDELIIGIGSNQIRKLLANKYKLRYAKAIHPSAIVSPSASIGSGTVIMQGAIVQSDAQVGAHCIVNTGATVDHECKIEDFVHISPHATLCGNVSIGEGSWIGAGAIVIPGIKIGKWCTIGAGSVVIRDVPDDSVAVGNPCKSLDNSD